MCAWSFNIQINGILTIRIPFMNRKYKMRCVRTCKPGDMVHAYLRMLIEITNKCPEAVSCDSSKTPIIEYLNPKEAA